jgi:hypothetical protein
MKMLGQSLLDRCAPVSLPEATEHERSAVGHREQKVVCAVGERRVGLQHGTKVREHNRHAALLVTLRLLADLRD